LTSIGAQLGQSIKRERAEAQVRAQKALLDAQNDATPDGILVVGPDGDIRSYNRSFVRMWNLNEEILADHAYKPAMRAILAQLAEPERFLAQIRYLNDHRDEPSSDVFDLLDGRIIERWSGPVRAPDGGYHGRAWFFRDVSESKRAQRALIQSGERAHFLAEATEILSASLDADATLQSLAELILENLADACTIELVERPPEFEMRRAASTYANSELRAHAERRAPGWDMTANTFEVIRTGRSLIIPNVPDAVIERETLDQRARELHPRATIIVPLPAGPSVLGAIVMHRIGADREYRGGDLALAEDIGRRAALAVDNARLYADRSHVARTLQESLLPPALPRPEGLELGACYHAAGRGLDVGGDFYDAFGIDDEWIVTIGDVCGKGAEAAASTALARYTLRASALQARRPSRVLRMLNDAMLSQSIDSRFCTVAYARVRRSADGGARLTLACGGHPLPVLLRADGTLRTVGTPGTLMGVFPQPSLTDRTIALNPGDSVIFYTDGVIDARGDEGPFGEERMLEVIARCNGMSAQEIADELARAALDWENGHPRDDIAVVALKVTK
jgi:serine phosphatase RsbU (regulator of sigma subunit)